MKKGRTGDIVGRKCEMEARLFACLMSNTEKKECVRPTAKKRKQKRVWAFSEVVRIGKPLTATQKVGWLV